MSRKLNDRQLRAAEMLVAGTSVVKVGEQLGVAPETVSRWKHDAAFQARLHFLRNDASETARQRLRGMVETSLEVIEEILANEETPARVRLDAAFRVLERCGLDRVGDGGGSEDADQIERSRSLDSLYSLV
ncbi:MAG: hypothetical protein AAFZ38_07285 [Myxococcota bacterium]